MKKILIWILALVLLVGVVQATDFTEGWVFASYMNGTGNAIDVSGNGFDMTENGVVPEATGYAPTEEEKARGPFPTNGYLERQISDFPFLSVSNLGWTNTFWMGTNTIDSTGNVWNAREDPGHYWIIALTAGGFSYGANGCTVNALSALTHDVWYYVTLTYDGSDRNMTMYLNGTYQASCTKDSSTGTPAPFTMGVPAWDPGAEPLDDAVVDEFEFHNYTFTPAQVIESMTSYIPHGPPPPPPPIGNFTITNYDYWNGTQVINFNAVVNGTTHTSNASGVIEVDFLFNNTAQLDILINSSGYLNRSYLGYSPNLSGDLASRTYQAILCLNATAKVNEAWAYADNFTIGTNTSTDCFNITAGTHNVLAQKDGWYNRNQTITVTALSNATQTIVNMSYTTLTIYAIDGTTNESLSTYDLVIGSIANPSFLESATGVTNHSFYLINDTYNVTIDKAGYAITTATANISVSGHTNYTFTLYKSNSVSITILDEITNNPILSNITVRWTDNATTWENITDTGDLFVHNITPGNYTVLFYGSNYSTRTYTITVGNLSTQFLTAYMISSAYVTIFTIKDQDTGDVMSDVSFTMYKLINSSWSPVESKYSDITGKVQIYYDPIGNYRFFLSKEAYEDLIFYLNPILFSTYDVFMVKSSLLNYSVDYDDLSIIYGPQTFNNNANTTFNFLISSPDGLLTDYSITLIYPGGSSSASGVNAIGEQLSVWVNITNATRWDTVQLDYNYTTTISGTRTFTQYLSIRTNATASENTWTANQDRTYGLGLFERVLIVTIIVIFAVGIATMVGNPIPGLAIGLFLFGFMVKIGFIPIWSILPSMFIGLLFLVWKSGGY